jgi:dihydroflavonol-4-reductase
LKTLVTGGSGFVGSHLVRRLLDQGVQVRVMARRPQDCAALHQLPLELVAGDLCDSDSLNRAVEGCSQVFHCAADYRLWTRNPQELYQANVDGTAQLFESCLRHGIEKVIYTSSVAAVGIPKNRPGDEDVPVKLEDMIGHYKRSKFLAQQVAFQYADKGLPVVLVSPSTPIGSRDAKPTATGKIIVDFLNNKMPAYIDTGLNLVAVEDVVEGHLLAAQRGQIGRAYIVGHQDMSLAKILYRLAVLTGKSTFRVPLPYHFVYGIAWLENLISERLLGREPMIPLEAVKMARKKMYFSWERARRELDYGPRYSVDAALTSAVCWYVENGYAPPPPAYLRLKDTDALGRLNQEMDERLRTQ